MGSNCVTGSNFGIRQIVGISVETKLINGGAVVREFKYFKPESLKEASDLLVTYGDGAHILNGGTDLLTRIKAGVTRVDQVIDIKGIGGLDQLGFTKEDGLFIGACVTLNSLMKNDDVKRHYPMLIEAIHLLGSTQIRNRATCIGNLCNASPLADTATPLLVMDAVVHVYGKDGPRDISIHDFFTSVRKTSLIEGDIVTGVTLPYEEDFHGYFHKTSRRKEVDLAIVCASVARVKNDYRIALGAVAPTPIRASRTEAFLMDKRLNEDVIKRASLMIAGEISPIDDVRSTKEYRMDIAQVLVERGLELLMKGDR
nr:MULTISPECIES: xanthine dehydrogenase family protein subunit M [unclassified Fusibacter]